MTRLRLESLDSFVGAQYAQDFEKAFDASNREIALANKVQFKSKELVELL